MHYLHAAGAWDLEALMVAVAFAGACHPVMVPDKALPAGCPEQVALIGATLPGLNLAGATGQLVG